MEQENIETEDNSFATRLQVNFFEVLSKCFLPFLLLFVLTFSIYLGLLPAQWKDALQLVLGTVFLVLGIPLSVALRVDQLSFRLGGSYSSEEVLLISLVVACINILLLLTVKRLIVGGKKEKEED